MPNNTCTQACPNGTFYNSTSLSCQTCTSNCNRCIINATNCIDCIASTYFLNSTCFSVCPDNYYGNGGNCTACVTPCLLCSSSSSCTSCIANYYFYKNTCVTSCTDITTIPINGSCIACGGVCYTCNGSLTTCTSCKSNLIFYNNSCLISCPAGTYLSTSNISISNCLSCLSPCVTCTTSTACTSCISSQYLYSTSCMTTCPSGTIPSGTIC